MSAPASVVALGEYVVIETVPDVITGFNSALAGFGTAGFGTVDLVGLDVTICEVGDNVFFTNGISFTNGVANSAWFVVHQDYVKFKYTGAL